MQTYTPNLTLPPRNLTSLTTGAHLTWIELDRWLETDWVFCQDVMGPSAMANAVVAGALAEADIARSLFLGLPEGKPSSGA